MDDFGIKKIELKNDLQSGRSAQNQKVDIEKKVEYPKQDSMSRKKRFPFFKSRKFLMSLGIVVLVLGLLAIIGVMATRTLYADGMRVYEQSKKVSAAAKDQNVILAKEELVKTQRELDILKKDLSVYGFARFIPIISGYYNDATHLTNAGNSGIKAAISVTDSLIPYADVLGLKGGKSFVGGTAEQRIQLAVKTMGKVVPNIDKIEGDLTAAEKELAQVNPERYPPIGKLKELRTQLIAAKITAAEAVLAIQEAKPLIKVLPELLGEPESKRYLVLFQNDKELRPTGGFITYYAIFQISQGVLKVERSSNIYDLDDSVKSKPTAPYMIQKYLNESRLNLRNSNYKPDYIDSMEDFLTMYNSSSEEKNIDGIIALDTHVLVHIIDILGEVNAAGLTFNSKVDERCDCPQVLFELESQVSRPVNYIRENRKALIGELLFAIMQKALASSPKEYWGPLFQQGFSDIHNKHILFYLFNKDAQKGIEALNWAGRIDEDFDGDYIHINQANFGGQKANMFVKENVRIDYEKDGDSITRTITINYKNPQPGSDCNLERGGLCLNAPLRDFIRIYNPKSTQLVEVKGSEVKVDTKEEYGKTQVEGFLVVRPLGSATYTMKVKLPFTPENGEFPLLIQKQPGNEGWPYEIYVNGRKVESFNLTSDKELRIKI